jgi:outer membrane protein OmpA-like peptidoglycan-associated protein
MRAGLRAVLVLAGVAGIAGAVRADVPGVRVYITPFGGYQIFDEELRLGYAPTRKLENAPVIGGRLGVQLNHWFAIEGAGGFVSTELQDTTSAKVKFTHFSGNLVLTPWSTSRGGLFWSEGFGWGRLKPQGGPKDSDVDQGLLESALGAVVNITQRFGVRLEGRHLFWIPKTDINKAHIKYWQAGLGLNFVFGGAGPPLDSDHDGVPDRLDKCPNTPPGCKVDANGCPLDSDADGVCDGLDQCEGTPKGCTVDAHGCPLDADGDGVCDGLDQCEGTPKGCTVDAHGCPIDSDGDGVCDGLDQCPNTPKGCTVDAHGCPLDSDGDGVCDGLDKCPNTPAGAKVDANGCPVVVHDYEREMLDTGRIRLENVHFQTDRWDIQPEDEARLDEVGQVLERWPQLRIEIQGHTDSRASRAHNLVLSRRRADSVLNYLVKKYPDIKAGQFTVKGYGEDRPLVPNTSVANMARNRRVEFVVLNRTVLQREVQRRRLLPQSAPADTTRH